MKYATPAAFRVALEARLNATARAGGRPVGHARKLVAFTRLLARLERAAPERWVLKGGFALELRVPGQTRATRDVDIDWHTSLDDAATALVEAAALDLGDYFAFDIRLVGDADVGSTGGGVRFRADASVAGRLFEPLLIDVGFASELLSPPDELTVPDLLDFAEIAPAQVRAIALEQHIAEKVHAYTRRHGDDQPSSRAKDLIDIVLMCELADFAFDRLREEIVRVFAARATHEPPASLPLPPGSGPVRMAHSRKRSASTPTRDQDTASPAGSSIRSSPPSLGSPSGTRRRSGGREHDPPLALGCDPRRAESRRITASREGASEQEFLCVDAHVPGRGRDRAYELPCSLREVHERRTWSRKSESPRYRLATTTPE